MGSARPDRDRLLSRSRRGVAANEVTVAEWPRAYALACRGLDGGPAAKLNSTRINATRARGPFQPGAFMMMVPPQRMPRQIYVA